jgi:hypothetical protein
MKPTLLLLILASGMTGHVSAQKTTKYYDFSWKETDVSHARFVSIVERTDSGWHRLDYFVQGPTLQMEGWYEDSAEKVGTGKFTWGYPDNKLKMTGRYLHGKRQGLWLVYHPNGMMADSVFYDAGNPIGTELRWFRDGTPSDSSVNNPDGSAVEVSWFDNGNPSSAGRYSGGHKMNGRWQFFHDNGKLSAIELYDNGKLQQKQYFDENGQAMIDTITKDKEAMFTGGINAWLKYLGNHLHFPSNYTITNGDEAAVVLTFTVDTDGTVKDAYISVPFHAPFEKEALYTVLHSPKWQPAIDHNRHVESVMVQPVIFRQPDDN